MYIGSFSALFYIEHAHPPGTLPREVAFTPSTRDYHIQIRVTDILNLTDSFLITHRGKGLFLKAAN